jgi:hypothetical protein
VALKPGSEPPLEGEPVDYAEHHPKESPEQWGWHGEFGVSARIAGWVVVAILLVMTTATHYNGTGDLALLISAGLLVVALLWDISRRRTSWRR